MKLNSNIWKVLCGVLIACLFAACKSSSSTVTSGTEIMKTEEAFFSSVLEQTFRFNTLSARMKLDFSGMQNEFSSRVQLKMVYNDRLQLSIQPFLGIEMFRIEMTNDSIKILDRMSKRYVVDNYENLKKELDIEFSFQNLQALFTNQLFIPGERNVSRRDFRRFRMTTENHLAELKLKDRNGLFYTFTADSEERLLSTLIESRPHNRVLTWNYSNFQTTGRQRFPMKMTVHLSSGEKTQGAATLTYSTPEINNPMTLDFTIPSGYSRVTLEQIINSLRKK